MISEQRNTKVIRNYSGSRNSNWKGGKVKVACAICGKVISLKRKDVKEENCCSRTCLGKWNSLRWKRKREEKLLNSKYSCANCGIKIIPVHFIDGHTGNKIKHHFCSRKCFSEWQRGASIGNKNPNWQGGVTPLRHYLYNCEQSKEWRTKVRKRDDYTCQRCGSRNQIQVHHKIRLAVLIQEFLQEYNQFSPIEDREILIRLAMKWQPFWDIGNGESLCAKCHPKEEGHNSIK